MALKVSSLEEFLKKYTANSAADNGAMSRDRYAASLGRSPESDYTSAVSAALLKRETSSPGYGTVAESLKDSGLSRTGYAEYLASRSRNELDSALSGALDDKLASEDEISSAYAKYLKSYKDAQTSKMNTVRNQLLSNEIVNLDTTYAIAVNSGLSADDAAAVSIEVYEVLRDRIENECLERVAALELDSEGAALYAKNMGLSDEDAANIAKKAEDYLKYYKDHSGSYLDYLEERSSSIR